MSLQVEWFEHWMIFFFSREAINISCLIKYACFAFQICKELYYMYKLCMYEI